MQKLQEKGLKMLFKDLVDRYSIDEFKEFIIKEFEMSDYSICNHLLEALIELKETEVISTDIAIVVYIEKDEFELNNMLAICVAGIEDKYKNFNEEILYPLTFTDWREILGKEIYIEYPEPTENTSYLEIEELKEFLQDERVILLYILLEINDFYNSNKLNHLLDDIVQNFNPDKIKEDG